MNAKLGARYPGAIDMLGGMASDTGRTDARKKHTHNPPIFEKLILLYGYLTYCYCYRPATYQDTPTYSEPMLYATGSA